MNGEEDRFDHIVHPKSILNILNIFPSIVFLLEDSDVYLPTMQTGCQLYLDVGEFQLVIEIDFIDS